MGFLYYGHIWLLIDLLTSNASSTVTSSRCYQEEHGSQDQKVKMADMLRGYPHYPESLRHRLAFLWLVERDQWVVVSAVGGGVTADTAWFIPIRRENLIHTLSSLSPDPKQVPVLNL